MTVTQALRGNPYPGRGILLGQSEDGQSAVVAYFIMGRSVNSRNRVFVWEDGALYTRAFDPALLSDPSLVIYAPLRSLGERTIVTNGDQTDTVYEALQQGGSFAEALAKRCYEPDEPNFTPRISGVLTRDDKGGFFYSLSILKRAGGGCGRYTFDYEAPVPGVGHLLHTYQSDGEPLPSFFGEPREVTFFGDCDALTETLWDALDEENRVSLFVRFIDLASGAVTDRIVNKNQ